MKRFIVLFVLFFTLSTCFATASTLVQHSLDKKVFVQVVDTPATILEITAILEIQAFGLVRCPSFQESYIITNAIENNYKPTILNKTAEVQNKDVVWLTNMKSK